MREHGISSQWGSPKQVLTGYRNLLKVEDKEESSSFTKPKVTTLGEVKILSRRQETPVRRILFDSVKKETDQKLSDQTKKISFLKSDLSHLKVKVLELASIEKDLGLGQNGHTSSNISQYIKDGFSTPRHTESHSQSSTELKNSADTFDFNDDSASNFPSEAPVDADNSFTEHRLWDNLKRFQRKSPQQRDDLSCRARDSSRQSNFLRQSFQSNPGGQLPDRIRHFADNRESNDKGLQSLVDSLRRQNGDLQLYYKQKIEEANRLRQNIQSVLRGKEEELYKVRNQVLALQKSLVNQENLSKLVLNLQENTRKLEKEKLELADSAWAEQKKAGLAEEKLRKCEDQNKVIKDLKDRLLQQNMRLKESSRASNEQILKLRQSLNTTVNQKNREIQILSYDKEKLTKAVKYCSESHNSNMIRSSSLESRSKSEYTPSQKHLFISSPKSQQNLIEEKKKQLDSLCQKIQQLKNEKNTIEKQLETRQNTKKHAGSHFKRALQVVTVEALEGQLMLKDEIIDKMHKDIKVLEAFAQKNSKLEARLENFEEVLREANQQTIRCGLAFLNHKYN